MPQVSIKQFHVHDFSTDEVNMWLDSLQKDGVLSVESAIVAPLQGHRKAAETVRQRAQTKLAPLVKARQDAIAANAAAQRAHDDAVAAAKSANLPEPPAPTLAPVPELPALAMQDQASNVTFTWAIDRQTLDDWFRQEIVDLPEIGKYVVVQSPRNPDVVLRVRWEA